MKLAHSYTNSPSYLFVGVRAVGVGQLIVCALLLALFERDPAPAVAGIGNSAHVCVRRERAAPGGCVLLRVNFLCAGDMQYKAETIRLWVSTSSTAMGARNKSVLKYLEHRNACVGLAGNNSELAGNGKPELQAIAIASRFSG